MIAVFSIDHAAEPGGITRLRFHGVYEYDDTPSDINEPLYIEVELDTRVDVMLMGAKTRNVIPHTP